MSIILHDPSANLKNLYSALIQLQSKLEPIPMTKENPYYESKYADLADIWKSIRGPLKDNGLGLVQRLDVDDEGTQYLVTRLFHDSGEFLESRCKIVPVKNDPQSFGSAITYLRRYSVSAILGIVTEDDDDGAAGSGHEKDAGDQARNNANARVSNIDKKSETRGAARTHNEAEKEKPKIKDQASEAQLKRLFAISKAHKWDPEDLRMYCQERFKIASRTDMTWRQVNDAVAFIEGGGKYGK